MKVCTCGLVVVAVMAVISGQVFAEWTTPVPLSEVNTQYGEGWPTISSDGLTLYFTRSDTPGHYWHQMYQATRTTQSEPFSDVLKITSLEYSGHLCNPWISPDNLHLYFWRTESGSVWRLKESTRATEASPWGAVQNLTSLNSLGDVGNAKLSSDELSIVFNVFQNETTGSLYTASRNNHDSEFTNIRPLSELNTGDVRASFLSSDGLSLYFARNDNGFWHNYVSTRSSLTNLFGTAQLLNYWPENYGLGCFSADGQTAYLGYNRDIYVSTYIPEPATMALLGLGGVLLRRKMR